MNFSSTEGLTMSVENAQYLKYFEYSLIRLIVRNSVLVDGS